MGIKVINLTGILNSLITHLGRGIYAYTNTCLLPNGFNLPETVRKVLVYFLPSTFTRFEAFRTSESSGCS